MLISHWLVSERPNSKGMAVLLPGRGVPGSLMHQYFREMRLRRTTAVALVPRGRAWYAVPNGPHDQDQALRGLAYAVEEVSAAIDKLKNMWGTPDNKITLIGFSAGAVVANEVAIRTGRPFAAVVSTGGAILDTTNVPQATTQTLFLLQHGTHDDCFEWGERYIPMRQVLTSRGYCVKTHERPGGTHNLYRDDAHKAGEALASLLGYSAKYRQRMSSLPSWRRG